VELVLAPAAAGTGILFVRSDLDREIRFPARADWVVDTQLATTLGTPGFRLSTVEHLISALRGMGVDNCTVEVSGPELPIMDGSAAPFVYLVQQAGLRPQKRMRRRLVIRRPIEVRNGNRWVRVIPSRSFKISMTIDYPHPAVGRQSRFADFSEDSVFQRELAPARTFGFLADVQRMQSAGLALGGSLRNAVVLDDERVLNRGGLRFPDEFVRHKMLDMVGDLALLGLPLQGHVKAMRSGHALNQALVAEIRENSSCWTVEVPQVATPEPLEERARLPLPRLSHA
jgi:UDP-3-O-[3-hydroxymyristoyl] N-acetylglucosamine deacetylase